MGRSAREQHHLSTRDKTQHGLYVNFKTKEEEEEEEEVRCSIHLLLMMGAATAPHCEPVLLKSDSGDATRSLAETDVAPLSDVMDFTSKAPVSMPQLSLLSIEQLLTPPPPPPPTPTPPLVVDQPDDDSNAKDRNKSSLSSSSMTNESRDKKKASKIITKTTSEVGVKKGLLSKNSTSMAAKTRATNKSPARGGNGSHIRPTPGSPRVSGGSPRTSTTPQRPKASPAQRKVPMVSSSSKDRKVRSASTGFVRSQSMQEKRVTKVTKTKVSTPPLSSSGSTKATTKNKI